MPSEQTERERIGLMTETGRVLAAKTRAAGEPASTWGYLNRAGKVALPAVYAAATDFEGERAAVVLDGNLALIDTAGRVLLRGAWLCGRDPIVIDSNRRILWPAAAREVSRCE